MSTRPIILGIVGDSAAGKTTLTRGIAQILGPENVTIICTDDYHRYDRQQRAELGITALHPDCNHLDIIQQHLNLLRTGQAVLKPIYNHTTGSFDPPEYIKPNKFLIVEGLLGYSTRGMRDAYDVKVYLAPPEDLRTLWKVKRDTRKRGYSDAQVLAEMEKREPDSAAFIRPQRQWADLVVSFYPEARPETAPPDAVDANAAEVSLHVRLVLRPTIAHPDLNSIFEQRAESLKSAVRLGLDRDMGKPVDLLEVDSHTTATQVRDLERMICDEVPYLGQFCSINGATNIGQVIGTTGELLQSYPLAITQLLITYHMLKASNVS
jgi:phosphoribulokinase